MKTAKKGDWVQIEKVVLEAGHRAPQVPEDTQACDLKLWVKGLAQTEASAGEEIEIVTVTGRKDKGVPGRRESKIHPRLRRLPA